MFYTLDPLAPHVKVINATDGVTTHRYAPTPRTTHKKNPHPRREWGHAKNQNLWYKTKHPLVVTKLRVLLLLTLWEGRM
jgi:hypothetical protein